MAEHFTGKYLCPGEVVGRIVFFDMQFVLVGRNRCEKRERGSSVSNNSVRRRIRTALPLNDRGA